MLKSVSQKSGFNVQVVFPVYRVKIDHVMIVCDKSSIGLGLVSV